MTKEKKEIERVHADAKGQFVRSKAGSHNDGVLSAKPRVVTGTDDATFDTKPEPKSTRKHDAG